MDKETCGLAHLAEDKPLAEGEAPQILSRHALQLLQLMSVLPQVPVARWLGTG